ncbi:restriction endonuclease subunit S [Mycoplasmopsis bovis]|uniref:restriction endonuclease subunit S n=1 Tax=Mycoplasmopsis bovis TaxID=28903 RepID=UPI003D28568E
MMIASDVKKYGKFDVYDPNKIVGKTDAEPFRSDYISIVKDGDAGRIRLLPKNTMILSTMGALIAKDPFKIDFLYYMLNAINDLSRERNGSIIPHIYFKDYGQNIYNLPSIPEQSKISSLFTYLDSLITLHQRKLSSLKNLKNRLLDRMFCDEKSQFPSIRFTEFTNAWEQWKVGDLITERIEFTKESNEFPLMAFVANEGVVAKGERYDRSSLVRDIYNKIYKVTKYGDFIYSSNNLDRGSIGANKYGNACISPVYSIFKCTNSSDHNFIKNILSRHSFVNKLLKYRQGVVYGQLKIHESIFLNINLNSPSILEQNKIGKIFYNLDSLITLHQRKLLSLKNLKSRLLDRMFCDEKSQFPSIRFKEFTNAWEQDTAKNLFIPYRVKNSSNMNLVSYSVTNKDGFVNQNEYFDDGGKAVFADKKNSLIVSINTFAYNPSRINVGSLALYKHSEMGLVSPIYEVFQINNNNNPDFFLLWFRSEAFKNIVSTNSNKSVRDTLNLSQFESESVNFPNFAEQSKISSLFTHLDSLITLHQRKLLSLKNLKSRLLDRMFCDEKSQFPSIRFKEFTNTWEQDTAKNLFIPYRVKNSSNMNLVSYSVTNKDGFVNQNEYFDDGGKAVFADKKNSLIVSINTFAYNPSRINVGSLALYKHSEMGLVSPIYEVFQINNNNNPDFFLLWFRSEAFKNIVSTNSNKSVRDTLNLSQFESESVNFPNFAEQSKISSLFTHLDSLITLHQRKRITRTV